MYLKPPRCAVCPNCGHKVEEHVKEVLYERGTLREWNPDDELAGYVTAVRDRLSKEHVFGQLVWWGRQKGYSQWWPNMKFKDIYGVMFPRDLHYEDKISAPVVELLEFLYQSNEKFKREKTNERRREAYRQQRATGPAQRIARDQAIIDSVRERYAPGTLMREDDWEDFK